VDNNYLDLGMNKSGFVHTLPSGRLKIELFPGRPYDSCPPAAKLSPGYNCRASPN
jgi:hypothetical protein